MRLNRVVVISLARRADRLAAFRERWEATGLDAELMLTVQEAADGQDLEIPEPWSFNGPGAYGCYLSHVQALDSGGPLLVLEDDAVFAEDFAQTVRDVQPGEGWDLLYLGGQLVLPREVPQGEPLFAARRVMRSHAYVARRPRAVAQHLRRFVGLGMKVDQVLSHDEMRKLVRLPFVVGQDSGTSDTGDDRAEPEFWNR